MTVRVGVNGFGRIGRNFLRAARSAGADVEIVAVNDLVSPEANAHLLRYDSTHGRFGGEVVAEDGGIRVDGHLVRAFAENQPVTAIVDAIRNLLAGQPVGTDIWAALGWCVGLLAVAYSFAMLAYRRRLA